ncbi:MAG: DUF1801 domain-containing protein [Deltaproteobacteria bacterium]|nr:DUF1801 domain-containing protein [Deltaproteobacteria bacterium]
MPRRKEVDDWLASYDNPMKAVVERVRELILAADSRIDECIKWQAPTFTYGGNLASFFPKAKQHASLMFHTGGSIPGKHPRLEGEGVGRILRITSVEDADAAGKELAAIVAAWIKLRDAATPVAKNPRKTPKKKKPTKR